MAGSCWVRSKKHVVWDPVINYFLLLNRHIYSHAIHSRHDTHSTPSDDSLTTMCRTVTECREIHAMLPCRLQFLLLTTDVSWLGSLLPRHLRHDAFSVQCLTFEPQLPIYTHNLLSFRVKSTFCFCCSKTGSYANKSNQMVRSLAEQHHAQLMAQAPHFVWNIKCWHDEVRTREVYHSSHSDDGGGGGYYTTVRIQSPLLIPITFFASFLLLQLV